MSEIDKKTENIIEKTMETAMKELSPLYDHIDFCVEQAGNGIFRASVPSSRKITNHFNTIHAAVQFAVAESLGGLVWRSLNMGKGYIIVVRNLSIDFKRPAFSGINAQARFGEADVNRLKNALDSDGRCDYEVKSEIRDEDDGQIVSVVTACYAIRSAEKLQNKKP